MFSRNYSYESAFVFSCDPMSSPFHPFNYDFFLNSSSMNSIYVSFFCEFSLQSYHIFHFPINSPMDDRPTSLFSTFFENWPFFSTKRPQNYPNPFLLKFTYTHSIPTPFQYFSARRFLEN